MYKKVSTFTFPPYDRMSFDFEDEFGTFEVSKVLWNDARNYFDVHLMAYINRGIKMTVDKLLSTGWIKA